MAIDQKGTNLTGIKDTNLTGMKDTNLIATGTVQPVTNLLATNRTEPPPFNVRECDLRKLNSLTKYPSIPTYHEMGDRGALKEGPPFEFEGDAVVTEKIDGTNSRVILLPDKTFIIGSREELLYAQGDLIGDATLGITEALKEIATSIRNIVKWTSIVTFYFEVYGGKKVTQASKQYTASQTLGYRLFDVVQTMDFEEVLSLPLEKISSWRQHGGQKFTNELTLAHLAKEHKLKLTPRIEAVSPPREIEATLEYLREILPKSKATLDRKAPGRPEGVVVRSPDRSQIAKLRFEDYEKTMRRRADGQAKEENR